MLLTFGLDLVNEIINPNDRRFVFFFFYKREKHDQFKELAPRAISLGDLRNTGELG